MKCVASIFLLIVWTVWMVELAMLNSAWKLVINIPAYCWYHARSNYICIRITFSSALN